MGFNSGFKGLMYRLDYRGGKMDFSFSEVSRPAQCPDLLSVQTCSVSRPAQCPTSLQVNEYGWLFPWKWSSRGVRLTT